MPARTAAYLVEMAEAELDPTAAGRPARAGGRAIMDFAAVLTDSQAADMRETLCGRACRLWTDSFVS
jgi:dGTPase